MGSADVFGGSSGGGGSAGVFGGGGGHSSTGTSKKPRKSEPVHDLGSALVHLARTRERVSGHQQRRIDDAIVEQSRDLPHSELDRIIQSVPTKVRERIQAKRPENQPGSGTNAIEQTAGAGASLLGRALNVVAAPGRAVTSGVAEYSRQYEKQGRPLIPTDIDTSKVMDAYIEGGLDRRHDSFTSISREAGKERRKHGDSTKIFGGALPWKNDLRTNPVGGGKAGNILADLGAGVALDPLTYLTFGTGSLVKTGIRASVESLGAERTAVLVEKGFKALSAEEKARLGRDLAPKVFQALKRGARGGVQFHVPKVPFTRGAPRNIPKTILPGPLRGLRAAKIIEGSGGKSAVVKQGVQAAEQAAEQANQESKRLHGLADLAETQGASSAVTVPTGPTVRLYVNDEGTVLQRVADWATDDQVVHNVFHGNGRIIEVPESVVPQAVKENMAGKHYGINPVTGAIHPEVLAVLETDVRRGGAAATRAAETGTDVSRVAALRAQASDAEETAANARNRVDELLGGARREATTAAEKLRDTPLGRVAKLLGESKKVQGLGRAFIPRYDVARNQGQHVADQLGELDATYRGTYAARVEDDVNLVSKAMRDTKITRDELDNIVGPALDVGGSAAKVPENLRPVYDALHTVRQRFSQAQVDAGVTAEQRLHNTDEYLSRYLTPEAQKIEGVGPQYAPSVPGRPSVTANPSTKLMKRTEADAGKTIEEINAAYRAEHGVDKFDPDALTSTMRRSTEAYKDVGTREYANNVLKMTDDSGKRIIHTDDELRAAGMEPGKDAVDIDIPGVGKVWAPKEVAPEIKKSFELVVNDRATKDALDLLDKTMTWWKGMATVPLPFSFGFHARNGMGNIWLASIRGLMPTSKDYPWAMKVQGQMLRGKRKAGDVYAFLSPYDRKIVEAARKDNTLSGGFFEAGEELGHDPAFRVPFRHDTKANQAKRVGQAANPFDTKHFAPVTAGRKFGTGIEENARLALYKHVYEETGSFKEARRDVAKYLFDYGDLTGFERQVMKRFQAFYTFKRKALPVVVESLLKTPGKYSHFQEARLAVAGQAERPKGLYPSYLPELGGVPLPMGVSEALHKVPTLRFKKDEQNVLALDLPFLNTANELQPVAQAASEVPLLKNIPGLPKNPEGIKGIGKQLLTSEISGGAPGALSTLAQAFIAEKDAFSGRRLTGQNAAPLWAKLLHIDKERILNGGKEATIDTKAQYIAESLMPILGKVSSFSPQGDYEQEKAPRRRLSTYTGIRTYPLGPGASRGEALRRTEAVAQLIADLRAAGIDIASSRTKKASGGWGR